MILKDVQLIDCTELTHIVSQAINEKRLITEEDLAKVQTYSSDQMNAWLSHYYKIAKPTSLENHWADCLGYALLSGTVNTKMAEYHCPKSRWLQIAPSKSS